MDREYSYWIIPIYKNIKWDIEVLIIKSKLRGHRWFPKWHKEDWETPIQTASRELFEETWIIINDIENNIFKETYKERYTLQREWKPIEKYVTYFVCYTQSKEVKIQKDEIIDFLWLAIDKVEEMFTHKSSKALFQEAQNAILNS